jgi:hypothetical protein
MRRWNSEGGMSKGEGGRVSEKKGQWNGGTKEWGEDNTERTP